MSAHASVTSHKSEQKEGGEFFSQCLGRREINLGAVAIRAILQSDSSHVVPAPDQFQPCKSLDAERVRSEMCSALRMS